MKEIGTVTLETDRLILRRFETKDAEGIFRGFAGDASCARYLAWKPHPNAEYTKKILDFWIDEYEDGAYNWAVVKKETGEIVGNVKAMHVDRSGGIVEVGYCFGSYYRGNGYATEALTRVISFFLLECDCFLIEGICVAENVASARVMEKAGMSREATLRGRFFDRESARHLDTEVWSKKRD